MALHSDLLAQAEHLATREPRRPMQASLRRAVSTAYYALFHLLTFEASRIFVKDEQLLGIVNRAYGHSEMSRISKYFAAGAWPSAFDPLKSSMQVPQALRDLAKAFVELQQARHDADYDVNKQYNRGDALAVVEQTKQAFRD